MSESTKPSRIRSPSYPSIDLKTAVDRTEELYQFAKRSPVLVSAVLPKWGYNSKSANGMKTIAALKSYGLIEDSGKLAMRKIQLTDRAYRIIHGQKDSPDRIKAIQVAALNPEIYEYCWEEFGGPKHMPHDDALREHLILEKKFNETAVSGFLADYKETVTYAKLEDNDIIHGDVKTPPLDGQVEVGDLIQWESDGVLQFPEPVRVRAVKELEGQTWVFIESSETGILMNEAILEQKSVAASPTPPIMPIMAPQIATSENEREWLRGPLSRDIGYRLIVSGDIGPKEIGKLIKLLEAQKEVLSDFDGDEENQH